MSNCRPHDECIALAPAVRCFGNMAADEISSGMAPSPTGWNGALAGKTGHGVLSSGSMHGGNEHAAVDDAAAASPRHGRWPAPFRIRPPVDNHWWHAYGASHVSEATAIPFSATARHACFWPRDNDWPFWPKIEFTVTARHYQLIASTSLIALIALYCLGGLAGPQGRPGGSWMTPKGACCCCRCSAYCAASATPTNYCRRSCSFTCWRDCFGRPATRGFPRLARPVERSFGDRAVRLAHPLYGRRSTLPVKKASAANPRSDDWRGECRSDVALRPHPVRLECKLVQRGRVGARQAMTMSVSAPLPLTIRPPLARRVVTLPRLEHLYRW